MAEDFLFELGLEEMPAHVVTPSMRQLKERMEAFLAEHRLGYESIDMFSTPRRLAVRVNGLAERQDDIREEAKGPAKKIAQLEDGSWSKAAQGFVRGQGVTVDDIYFKEIKGEEYVFVEKFIEGQSAMSILPLMIDEVIKKMTFPTMMHWGNYHFKFIRPIHWIVALLGEQIVPMELLNIGSSNISQGHRFLGAPVQILRPKMYEAALMGQHVLVEPERRMTLIMEQMVEFANHNQWKLDMDPDLLEEVNNLVEYPTAFVGEFDEKYLNIPAEVLVTSMKEHQRYFPVMDVNGKLLPYFISVRNGLIDNIDKVIAGNEKVLTARLEDAEFFYREDQKHSIEEYVERLKDVTFHEKIGSMYEKMQRVVRISAILGERFGLTAEELSALDRAAHIYKFDLVTGMVGEFSELQGVMGEKYALLQGEDPMVATAIREHYMPISAEGKLPETKVGAVLALADKLDTVMSFFTAGMVPSGSNDPYALRRQTYGMVRIIEHFHWSFPLNAIQKQVMDVVNNEKLGLIYDYSMEELDEFFAGRMKQWLQRQNVRYDVIEAIIRNTQDDLCDQFEAALMLNRHLNDEDMKASTESLQRVANLAKKADNVGEITVERFENESERALYDAYQEIASKFDERTMEENYVALKSLQPLIDEYFDQTMIMVDDDNVKQNRLSQLYRINELTQSIAALDQLVIK